jgi:hypothetical protein
MPSISIQLPAIDADHQVEVEVKINGRKRTYNYRVEIFSWEQCVEPPQERAGCLKRIIENYDRNWQLIQIGSPPKNRFLLCSTKETEAESCCKVISKSP